MEDLMFGTVALCCAVQALCFLSKKTWVRLIPTMVVVASMLYHIVMTFVAVNAWYLVLAALHVVLLGSFGLVWLVYGVYWGARCHRN